MAKLGYTWYAKDWRANMDVSELTLQEKGFYRELIDECFLKNSSKIQLNERTFCRLHGINSRTFTKVLQKLHDSFLIVIENFDETIVYIPSTSKRLGVIGSASEGGKNSRKKVTKSNTKSKEKEKENINTVFSFESFWKIYPSKVGKAKCLTKYKSIEEADREKIKNTLNNFANYKPFETYTHPNPITYLNQERWDDELAKADVKSNKFKMERF